VHEIQVEKHMETVENERTVEELEKTDEMPWNHDTQEVVPESH
jgi:hypothetical protein